MSKSTITTELVKNGKIIKIVQVNETNVNEPLEYKASPDRDDEFVLANGSNLKPLYFEEILRDERGARNYPWSYIQEGNVEVIWVDITEERKNSGYSPNSYDLIIKEDHIATEKLNHLVRTYSDSDRKKIFDSIISAASNSGEHRKRMMTNPDFFNAMIAESRKALRGIEDLLEEKKKVTVIVEKYRTEFLLVLFDTGWELNSSD